MKRLLDPSLIPATLWDGQAMWLPPCLAQAYRTVIHRHKLDALVGMRDSKATAVGGTSQTEVDRYLSWTFAGSVARAELALLDPKSEVTPASDMYIISLTGNGLSLTDAPCGAGAAAFAFLTCIAELRERSVLPRLPLDVLLVGAEISEPMRSYAEELLAELRGPLEAQGIIVHAEFLAWDVTDPLSNTDLITKMTRASMTCEKRLLLVANFNAFLIRAGKLNAAMPQLGELFRHASGNDTAAMWIEPAMNSAMKPGGLFDRLRSTMKIQWRRIAKERSASDGAIRTSSVLYHLPSDPSKTARVRLAVMPFDLGRFP